MLPLHHFSARIGRNQRGILSHWKPSQNRVLLACLSNSSTGVAAVSSNYSGESSDGSRKLYAALVSASGVLVTLGWTCHSQSNTRNITQLESALATDDKTTTLLNWSGTHEVVVEDSHYWEPDSIAEVELIVDKCHQEGKPLRPLGSALSPNGIAFRPGGMISMSNLDRIVNVDVQNKTVTAQAGARVSQVVDALRAHDLTLPNLASIAEQQMGGFVQVGAHGTGKAIAPVDHYVTKLKLVTPAKGTIELTEEDGELFHLAKVGLGCLGVVVEVTMQCIPAHKLVEHTFVLTRKEAKEQLDTLLKKHKHVRYMWIPYEDAVVVVTNDPEDKVPDYILRQFSKVHDPKEKFKPLTDLLLQLSKEYEDLPTAKVYTEETIEGMGFGELRDALLAFSPLNMDHVKRVNKAEAQFWHNNEGYQTKPSDQLLQFDCGGQQWVLEVCFPTGTQKENNGNDMNFMEELLAGIEEEHIPAPAPIEQRWSASSCSLMSPAYGAPDGLHSWVGIIHYLPSEDEFQRRRITEAFTGKYCNLMRGVGQLYNATSHWAKLEIPLSIWQLVDLRVFLQSRFPIKLFNEARASLDPKGILSNRTIDLAFGKPGESE